MLNLRRDALNTVRDNTYFRPAEKDVWFGLIALLQQSRQGTFENGSLGEISYVQLVDQPRAYRAKIVTVRGTVRQVTQQTPAANELGLDSYHRLVVEPSDGTLWPIFVYCLELPAGLVGEVSAVEVSATGFFFKNLSYSTQDGLGIAPVVLAKSVSKTSPASGSTESFTRPRSSMASDQIPGTGGDVTVQPTSSMPELRDLLSMAGWDAERFGQFIDDHPLDDAERNELIELMWRVRTFDVGSINAWTRADVTMVDLLNEPGSHRGEMIGLVGRVVAIERQELSPRDVDRLELPAYYLCRLELPNKGGQAIIATSTVPTAWLQTTPLDEPASASALFLKHVSVDGPAAMFLAKRIAWHPTTANSHVTYGRSLLGGLRMDVGLLDDVRSRGPIRAAEREAFYQILDAVGRINAIRLIRMAHDNLNTVRNDWMRELNAAKDERHRTLAQEAIRRASEGHYSVAPLFNEPQRHVGDLVTFDGLARRVVKVTVDAQHEEENPNDIARRFGIREYFEMEVFTDDSQNYPLVCCVRELPTGFPTGGAIDVPVRVAGFFFKDWLYTTRGTRNDDATRSSGAATRAQYAPLLIGRAPLLLEPSQPESKLAHWMMGGLFVAALSGFWAFAWWFARGDRRSAEQTLAAGFSPPAGQFLNELNLPAANEPMKYSGPVDFNTSDSS